MPDLPNSASASISNIYPSLPSLNEVTSLLHLPGSCPPAPPTPKRFVFGTRSNDGISRNQFSAAAEEVLAQMNARLPSNAGKISQGLLQGKKIEVDRLVSVNKQLGENGWGLGASTSSAKADRYANAHEKEFAR